MTDTTAIAVPINKLHPNAWNPNSQDEDTFNELVKEIEEDGFDHPCQVVPCECEDIEGYHYKIIGGEHRWKACKVLGHENIDVTVYKDWDEDTQKFKTMRRNLLTGHTDPRKFTNMVKGMLEKGYEIESLPQAFGFTDEREFDKFFIREKDAKESTFLDALVEESKKEKYAVDSITDIITNIFSEAAGTVDQDYLFFTHKGSMIAVVLCDDEISKQVKKIHNRLKKTGEKMTDFIREAILDQLEKTPLTE